MAGSGVTTQKTWPAVNTEAQRRAGSSQSGHQYRYRTKVEIAIQVVLVCSGSRYPESVSEEIGKVFSPVRSAALCDRYKWAALPVVNLSSAGRPTGGGGKLLSS